eukprot:7780323-Lingulodinium_polyedra.AAC.1
MRWAWRSQVLRASREPDPIAVEKKKVPVNPRQLFIDDGAVWFEICGFRFNAIEPWTIAGVAGSTR